MIALDANILLEILEERKNQHAVRDALAHFQHRGEEASVSALSISHTFYMAEMHKLPLARVETLARAYTLHDVTAADAAWAVENYKGQDFEDALQVAAARREKCTAFLTLDKKLAKKYQNVLNIELIAA